MPPPKQMQTKLNAKQQLAAQQLASGLTGRQVAKALNINPATLSGWRQRIDFQLYLHELTAQAEQTLTESLTGLRLRALECLGELLDASPPIALKAATAILQTTLRNYEPLPPSRPAVDATAWNEMLEALKNANHAEAEAT